MYLGILANSRPTNDLSKISPKKVCCLFSHWGVPCIPIIRDPTWL